MWVPKNVNSMKLRASAKPGWYDALVMMKLFVGDPFERQWYTPLTVNELKLW